MIRYKKKYKYTPQRLFKQEKFEKKMVKRVLIAFAIEKKF